MIVTIEQLRAVINSRFGGVLTKGAHVPDGAACLHEALNVAAGRPWSDASGDLPDLRPLNDAPWPDDRARTSAMLRLAEAVVLPWSSWSLDQRRRWAERVAIDTVRRLVARLPGLPGAIRDQCTAANTLLAARMAMAVILPPRVPAIAAEAAWAAARASALVAAWAAPATAAKAAARAAAIAARAAATEEAADILNEAVDIWTTAAEYRALGESA